MMPFNRYPIQGSPHVHVTPERAQEALEARCEVQKRVRYDVEITGHEAPFRWEVQRWMPGASYSSLPTQDCKGEADTREEAMFEAAAAAREAEYKRLHEAAKVTETLFDCPLEPESTTNDA